MASKGNEDVESTEMHEWDLMLSNPDYCPNESALRHVVNVYNEADKQEITETNKHIMEYIGTLISNQNKKNDEKNEINICEIGPGGGYALDLLIDNEYNFDQISKINIFAFDISNKCVELLNKKFNSMKMDKSKVNLQILNKDFADKQLVDFIETNTLDIIYHCNCFYFWKNLDFCGAELHRMLAKGGILIGAMGFVFAS